MEKSHGHPCDELIVAIIRLRATVEEHIAVMDHLNSCGDCRQKACDVRESLRNASKTKSPMSIKKVA